MVITGKDYWDACRVTPVEYSYLERAKRVKDAEYIDRIHLLAWKMLEVKATENAKSNRYKYQNFVQFRDSEYENIKAMYGQSVADEAMEKYNAMIDDLNGSESNIFSLEDLIGVKD